MRAKDKNEERNLTVVKMKMTLAMKESLKKKKRKILNQPDHLPVPLVRPDVVPSRMVRILLKVMLRRKKKWIQNVNQDSVNGMMNS